MPSMFPVRIDPNDVLTHPYNWEEITYLKALSHYSTIPVVMVTHNGAFAHAQLIGEWGNWGFDQVIDPQARFYSQVGLNRLPTAMSPVPHAMKLSAKGRTMLENLEWTGKDGWHKDTQLFFPYLDSAKKWTMGIGHLVVPRDNGSGFDKGYTLQQVQDLFTQDILNKEAPLNKQLKMGVSQQQFDALLLFVFNLGVREIPPFDAIRVLNSGGSVKEEDFTRYCHEDDPNNPGHKRENKGLKNRHKEEWQVFATGVYK